MPRHQHNEAGPCHAPYTLSLHQYAYIKRCTVYIYRDDEPHVGPMIAYITIWISLVVDSQSVAGGCLPSESQSSHRSPPPGSSAISNNTTTDPQIPTLHAQRSTTPKMHHMASASHSHAQQYTVQSLGALSAHGTYKRLAGAPPACCCLGGRGTSFASCTTTLPTDAPLYNRSTAAGTELMPTNLTGSMDTCSFPASSS